MKDIVIVGSSGLAKEIAFLLEDINKTTKEWNFIGFINENLGEKVWKSKVIMNDDQLLNYHKNLYIVFGLGFPNLIKKLVIKFKQNSNLVFPNIIHPNVIGDWERVKLGEGNIITAGNILTTDIEIGSFNIFNLNGTVGHNAKIGNYNVLNPTFNISGNVIVQNSILIGTGAQILQELSIVSETIIGAGAVVTKNIDIPGIYVGSPAKLR